MKKWIKILSISFAVLFLILLALPFLFKGKIIQSLKTSINASVNAKVDFSDQIDLSLISSFPNLKLGIHDLSVIGKDSFSSDTLIQMRSCEVVIDIMSVIKGETYEIRKIYLEQPRVHLLVLPSGKANWDITLPDTSTTKSESQFKLSLKKLTIESAHLVYDDKQLGFYTELSNFNHNLSGDFTQDNFDLLTHTDAEALTMSYAGMPILYKIKTSIDANLGMDMKAFKFSFKDNTILLNDLQIGSEGFVDLNDNDIDMDLVFNTKQTGFKSLMSVIPGMYQAGFKDATAKGQFALNGYMKGKMTELAMPDFGLKLSVQNGYFKYANMPMSVDQVGIDLSVESKGMQPDLTKIDLNRFFAVIANQPISAQLMVRQPISNPLVKGHLKGQMDLGSIQTFVPLEAGTKLSGKLLADVSFDGRVLPLQSGQYDQFKAAGNIAIQGLNYASNDFKQGLAMDIQMQVSPQKFDLQQMVGHIGLTDLNCTGYLDNVFAYAFNDEGLSGQFNLQSNYMNVNEFLSDEPTTKTAPTASDSIALQAFEVPANIDFDFSANINEMVYDHYTLKQMQGHIIARNQQLYLKDLQLQTLGGQMALNGVYDSKMPKYPFSQLDFKLSGLDIIQTYQTVGMVQQFAPIAKYTQGLLDANIQMSNHYQSDFTPDYPSVNAKLQVALNNAAIKQLPALKAIATALNLPRLNQLNLSKQVFTMAISDGKMVLDSMHVQLWEGAKAKISGYTALDQSIQYVAKLSIPRKDFGTVNTQLDQLTLEAKQKGLNLQLSDMVDVDVLLSGKFNQPIVKVSLQDAKKNIVDAMKNQLKAEADKALAEAQQMAQKQLEAAKKRATDSLNQIKQKQLDQLAKDKEALEAKALEEKQKAEAAAKQEADRLKQEAKDQLKIQKGKALDGLKGTLKGK
jgi:hypothetical protein